VGVSCYTPFDIDLYYILWDTSMPFDAWNSVINR